MDNKWLWIGGAVVLVALLVMSRGSGTGAQVIPAADTSAETAARFGFASAGLGELAKVASDSLGYEAATAQTSTLAAAQVSVEQSRSNALVASANAYADAQKHTADKAEQAQSNSSFWNSFGNILSGAGDLLAVIGL